MGQTVKLYNHFTNYIARTEVFRAERVCVGGACIAMETMLQTQFTVPFRYQCMEWVSDYEDDHVIVRPILCGDAWMESNHLYDNFTLIEISTKLFC